MTRVIFLTASTLNGFLADEQDSLDWLFAVPTEDQLNADLDAFFADVAVMIEGSATYRWVVEHEELETHPEKWQALYAGRPTWVFTTKTQPVIEGADVRFVSGSVADAWPDIAAAADGGTVWVVGGGDLVGQFYDAGLLDEVRVSIAPAVLVSGKPLLPRVIGSDVLELTGVRQTGQFAELAYAVRKP